MTRRILLAALLLVAAPAVAGCGADEPVSASGQAFVAGDGSIVTLPPQDRGTAPELSGTDLDGNEVRLDQWRGRVVVVNVWASWCPPCRAEAPALREVYETTRRRDVEFLGLATRDSDTAAQAFARAQRLDYPHMSDPDGSLQLLFRDTLPPQAIPSTVVIDRQGRVAGRVLGEVSAAGLRGLIEPLVAEGGGGS